jgi:hypothetical protein
VVVPPSTPDAPLQAPARPSTRVRLARLALDGALAVENVVAGHSGPSGAHVSVAEGGTAVGVIAAARPDGRYDVSLALVARPVSLHPLAEEVRRCVGEAASQVGLADALGTVDVAFEDVREAGPATPAGA